MLQVSRVRPRGWLLSGEWAQGATGGVVGTTVDGNNTRTITPSSVICTSTGLSLNSQSPELFRLKVTRQRRQNYQWLFVGAYDTAGRSGSITQTCPACFSSQVALLHAVTGKRMMEMPHSDPSVQLLLEKNAHTLPAIIHIDMMRER